MKPLLLFIALLVSTFAYAQAWQHYEPFGDTLGVYGISLNNANAAWFIACRTDGHNLALVTRTIDGGATFNTDTLPLQGIPYSACISSSDESTAYVLALQDWGNGITLKTVDGGQTWQNTNTPWDPVVSWPDYIHAFSPAKICQIGDPRNGEFEIYTSGNGGISWVLVNGTNIPDPLPGEIGFNNGGCVIGNHIWFPTSSGRIYHSANAGSTWDVVQTPLKSVGSISYSDEYNGIANGTAADDSDHLIRTTDGGVTWTDLSLPIAETYHFYGIPEYLKGSSTMVAGVFTGPYLLGKNQTWLSKDRGNTWILISDGEVAGWPTFNSATNGWAGEWGPIIPTDHSTRVFKYIGSPLVGLFSPNSLNADISISPNPTSDFIQIELNNAEPSAFWCLLNDAQGHLIRKFEIEKTVDFTQKIELKGLPNGTYIVTVASEQGSVTKQVVKH